MIKPAVLDAMVAAGCSAAQIAAAVKADQTSSSGAERQARYRARKASQSDERDVTPVTVTADLSPKESPPTPPKEITPFPVSEADASSTVRPEPAKAAPVAVIGLPTVSEGDFPVFEADVAEWQTAFPAVNVRQQLASMRQWLIANQTKRKTARGMKRFVVSWLDRKQNEGGGGLVPPRGQGPPQEIRTIGELAIHRLETGQSRNEPTGYANGRMDQGDGRGQAESPRSAQLIALAANSLGRIK